MLSAVGTTRRERMAKGRKLPSDFTRIPSKYDWPDCSTSEPQFDPSDTARSRKFYVYDTARPPVFRMTVDELESRGWTRVDKRHLCEAELVFTNGQRRFGWKKLAPYHTTNHLFMERYIADKSTLADHLAAVKEEGVLTPFWPETYWMRDVVDRNLFSEVLRAEAIPNPPFLVKDPTLHRGTGVKFLETKDIPSRLARLALAPDADAKGHDIIQRYVPGPLLLPPKGRKFDLRVYWFIASVDPVRVYYHDGTTRSSLESFDPDDLKNMGQHLTNVAIQKKNKEAYAEQKEELRLSFDALDVILREAFPEHPDPMEDVRAQMRHAIATVFLSGLDELKDLRYTDRGFSLLGGDFIIDDHLHVWLLEIQEGPVRSTMTDATLNMWLDMTSEQLDILFEIEEAFNSGGAENVPRDLLTVRNFQLVVDSEGEVVRPLDNLPVARAVLSGDEAAAKELPAAQHHSVGALAEEEA